MNEYLEVLQRRPTQGNHRYHEEDEICSRVSCNAFDGCSCVVARSTLTADPLVLLVTCDINASGFSQ